MTIQPNSTFPAFHTLPLGAIRPRGWLRAQLNHDLEHGFVSVLDTLTHHASRDLFKDRIESSAEQFAWWDSETRGNWLWGYTLMAFLADQPEHVVRVKTLLHDLKNTQDPDGYIGIYSTQSRYQHRRGENGELWGQGRALLALLTYYEFTGDPTFVEAVERAARLTMAQYGVGRSYYHAHDPLTNLVGATHGLCYVDVMAWLYRLTGENAYRDFGVWLYDDFSALPVPFPNDDLSLRSLADHNRYLGGHAVHTAEHLRVLAWALAMTGRDDLARAYKQARLKLAKYILPSGALMGDESLHGMPLPESGYEFCTTTELLFSLCQIVQMVGGARDADHIESLLFNAGQGARSADGSGVAYLSQDTRLDARADRPDSYSFFHGIAGRFKFSPTHEDVACCCNPNSTRLLPHYLSQMWMHLPDRAGIAAVLYGACVVQTEIDGTPIRIDENTDYPFADDVHFAITLERPLVFRLMLRKPTWATGATVTINGMAAQGMLSIDGDWLILDQEWHGGDQVGLTLTARPQTVAYPNGEVAIVRGALQYVLPIPARQRTLKTYEGSPLVDVELEPQDLAQAYQVFLVDPVQPDYGLQFQNSAAADLLQPWAHPPVRLAYAGGVLVPMGCAILRRAAFPFQSIPEVAS